MDSYRAVFTDSLDSYQYCRVGATNNAGIENYQNVWVNQSSTYDNYLYIKFKGSSTEHLFLSNTKMGIMEHFSDDDSRRYISIPSYYKPDSTYTTGDHYTLTSGSNAWSKTTTSGNINTSFWTLTGTSAKLENIGNWFYKIRYNYTVPTYKNNTAGVISTYNTSFFQSNTQY